MSWESWSDLGNWTNCMKGVNLGWILAFIVIACLCWAGGKSIGRVWNFDEFQYLPILTIAPCPTPGEGDMGEMWCNFSRTQTRWIFPALGVSSTLFQNEFHEFHIVDQPRPPSCLCPRATGNCSSSRDPSIRLICRPPVKLIEFAICKHCFTREYGTNTQGLKKRSGENVDPFF